MGSGGNFARTLTIDAKGNLTAVGGPLNRTDLNINIKLYAYVYQTRDNGSGAAFTAELDEAGINALPSVVDGAPVEWIIRRAEALGGQDGGPEQEGIFQEGPATGVALAIARTPDDDPPVTTVTWWTDTITLVRAALTDS